MFVDGVVTFGDRDKLKEVQRICTDISKALPTSVDEVVELSRDFVESKRENAKLVNRLNVRDRKLNEGQLVEWLECVKMKVATTRV